MDEEQRLKVILNRLMEMGIQVDKPIFTLIWQDVARVMVETEGFEMAAGAPKSA
jgi:Fe2+ transport system protein FeoA